VNNKSIFRELALLKVLVTGDKLKKVKKLCNSFKAKILDQTKNSMIIELNSYQEDIDKLIKSLKPLGLASTSRTGPLAMVKGAELKEMNKGKVI
jgi:acetolactate synthase-1/3 small subunit